MAMNKVQHNRHVQIKQAHSTVCWMQGSFIAPTGWCPSTVYKVGWGNVERTPEFSIHPCLPQTLHTVCMCETSSTGAFRTLSSWNKDGFTEFRKQGMNCSPFEIFWPCVLFTDQFSLFRQPYEALTKYTPKQLLHSILTLATPQCMLNSTRNVEQ